VNAGQNQMSALGESVVLPDAVLAALTYAQTPLWVYDIDNGRHLWANQSGLRLWRAESLAELCTRDMRLDMSATVAQRLRQYQADFARGTETFSEVWTLYPKGEPVTLQVTFMGLPLADGRMAMLCEGLLAMENTPEAIRSVEALLHTSVMISLYDESGNAIYRNPAARRSAEAGRDAFSQRFIEGADRQRIEAALAAGGEASLITNVRTERGVVAHEVVVRQCHDAVTGQPARLVSETDVSSLLEAESEALFLAQHDVLSGLPNRAMVRVEFDRLLRTAAQPQTASDLQIGMLYIDMDRFKLVNDSLGHAIGDELLIAISERLRRSLVGGEFIARVGGDEFLILVAHPNGGRAWLQEIVNRACAEFRDPVQVGEIFWRVTPSVGIAVYPDDGRDVTTLMRRADLAMYEAKRLGGNGAVWFNMAMDQRLQQRLELERELHDALEKSQFELHYQPRVAVTDNRIVGAEALVRWRHPSRGLIPPREFIPLCEDTGLIKPLGLWIAGEAMRQQARWQAAGIRLPISINISAQQMMAPFFVDAMVALLAEHHRNPQQIELEVTESMLLGPDTDASRTLERLIEAGFRIAIDDFGTGYSNLANLERYRVDTLKIDRSFIVTLDTASPITDLILGMARMLNMKVVAEGVDSPRQLHWLRERGCQEYQGFLHSEPMTADALWQRLGESDVG
jgi:diguanylate cyclase (GGDEF)-like protein